MNLDFAAFTGLAWALYKNDLKMAAIFFVDGASPEGNEFDGVVQNMVSFWIVMMHGTIDLKIECKKLCDCANTLAHDLQYSSAELKSLILACILVFRQLGWLSKNIIISIVERTVVNKMWELLKSFAMRGDANEEDANTSDAEESHHSKT